MTSFEVEHFYRDFEQQKFWEFWVDHEWYSESDLMPGKIIIEIPGKDHSGGLGAVRRLKIGRMELVEEIAGFDPPGYFCYAVREGMPVNGYRGEIFLEPGDGGLHFRYRGTFERKYWGTLWLMKRIFASRIYKMIPVWAEAYNTYYRTRKES